MNRSWVDLTLTEAVEELAKCAAASRGMLPSYLEKRALGESNLLTSLGGLVQDNPVLAKALLGGGVGALGAGAAAAFGNRGKPKSERKSLLGSVLTGGLAGSALGGGIGLVQKHWNPQPAEPPMAQGVTFTHDGRPHQVDPAAVARNPDIVSQIRGLQSSSWLDTANQGTWPGMWAAAPFTAMQSLNRSLLHPVLRRIKSGPAANLYGGSNIASDMRRGVTGSLPYDAPLQQASRDFMTGLTSATTGRGAVRPELGQVRARLLQNPSLAREYVSSALRAGTSSTTPLSLGRGWQSNPLTASDVGHMMETARAARMAQGNLPGRLARGGRALAPAMAADAALFLLRNYIGNRLRDSELDSTLAPYIRPAPGN